MPTPGYLVAILARSKDGILTPKSEERIKYSVLRVIMIGAVLVSIQSN